MAPGPLYRGYCSCRERHGLQKTHAHPAANSHRQRSKPLNVDRYASCGFATLKLSLYTQPMNSQGSEARSDMPSLKGIARVAG